RANEDGNAATEPDAEWLSLLAMPPYPAYTGNMAAVGMTHATILALFFGRDDIRFQNTWEGTPTEGRTRSYLGFGHMAQEEANSRIYGGIHYRFDNEAGQSIGRNVANYVFLNFLRPRHSRR
ncbi:MAG TPA: phosphoesterase PA-phosphatase, partial [Blastocatellia bacterium]|nr:phosphoesterase PA-phosphatase [Blastocatellia bacterium]